MHVCPKKKIQTICLIRVIFQKKIAHMVKKFFNEANITYFNTQIYKTNTRFAISKIVLGCSDYQGTS